MKWFVVIVECWKHWDSENSTVKSEVVYAEDASNAMREATDWVFERGFGAVTIHEVLRVEDNWARLVFRA